MTRPSTVNIGDRIMEDRRLTILQMNDTHGYLEPHAELVWRGRAPSFPILGGFARIAMAATSTNCR